MLRLILIAITSLLYACAAETSQEQSKSTIQLTEADAGSLLELRVGDILEVTLPGNPTTGFQWEVSEINSAILEPIGEPKFEPSSNAVGSGGNVTLRFEAVGMGQAELKLIHHRPFEENVPPMQTFDVTITVG